MALSVFKINGESFDDVVMVTSISETATKLSQDGSGRTQSGTMYMKLIGVYFNYTLKLHRKANATNKRWDELYTLLTKKNEYDSITVIHNQVNKTFTAYITEVKRELGENSVSKSGAKWGDIEITYTARSPQNWS
jgi:hydrogenase maturation factor HypF (carbamoyltransferase family)